MDVSLHPEFTKNRWIYLTYSSGKKGANRMVMAKATISKDLSRVGDVNEIFKVSRPKKGTQHFGSRLLWMKDGSLLMSIGDGGNPPISLDGRHIRLQAQNTGSHFGKVLRMDDGGKAKADNPFVENPTANADPYVWTYGHRNIQGLALHPITGSVWASEHGARGGDELNVLSSGNNYGWPSATHSIEYWGPKISDSKSIDGMVDPLVIWTPSIAPSGLTFYTGNDFEAWKGDLFAGALAFRQIRRMKMEGEEVVGQTTLQFKERIRWVGQGPDKGLYVLTDESDGRLFKIVPK